MLGCLGPAEAEAEPVGLIEAEEEDVALAGAEGGEVGPERGLRLRFPRV